MQTELEIRRMDDGMMDEGGALDLMDEDALLGGAGGFGPPGRTGPGPSHAHLVSAARPKR
jgi:hypothetical protein